MASSLCDIFLYITVCSGRQARALSLPKTPSPRQHHFLRKMRLKAQAGRDRQREGWIVGEGMQRVLIKEANPRSRSRNRSCSDDWIILFRTISVCVGGPVSKSFSKARFTHCSQICVQTIVNSKLNLLFLWLNNRDKNAGQESHTHSGH